LWGEVDIRGADGWAHPSNTNRAVSTRDVLGIACHFEKMPYDNAQSARVYLHAWQVTGEPFYRAIVEGAMAHGVDVDVLMKDLNDTVLVAQDN
jgi:hypothetical protein